MKYNTKKEILFRYFATYFNAARLPWIYRRTMWYLLRKNGLRAVYKFLWAKLVVREVGPGVLDPLFRTLPRTAPKGRYIEYEVTTKCNLNCAHCERTHWKEKPKDMSYKKFKKFFKHSRRLIL